MCDYMTPFPEQMTIHIGSHVAPEIIHVKEELEDENYRHSIERPDSIGASNSVKSGSTSNTSSSVVVKTCFKTYGKKVATKQDPALPHPAMTVVEQFQNKTKSDTDQLNLAIKEVRSVSEDSDTSSATHMSTPSDVDLSSVASEALIGILAPRRVKLAAKNAAKQSESAETTDTAVSEEVDLQIRCETGTTQAVNKAPTQADDKTPAQPGAKRRSQTVDKAIPQEEKSTEISSQAVPVHELQQRRGRNIFIKYKHDQSVGVRFFKDQARIIATDKKCPTIRPKDGLTVEAEDSGVELDSEFKTPLSTDNSHTPIIHHLVSQVAESLNQSPVNIQCLDNQPSKKPVAETSHEDARNITEGADNSCGKGQEAKDVGKSTAVLEPVTTCSQPTGDVSRSYRKPKHDILMRYHGEQQKLAESTNATPISEEPSVVVPLRVSESKTVCSPTKDFVSASYHVKVSYGKALPVASSNKETLKPKASKMTNDQLLKTTQVRLKRISADDDLNHTEFDGNKFEKLRSSFQHYFKKKRLNDNTQPRLALRRVRNKSKSNLRSNLSKQYRCSFCEFQTPSKDDLFTHTNEQHAEEEEMYICDQCDYMTSRQSKLLSHKKTHPEQKKTPEGTKTRQSQRLVNDLHAANSKRSVISNVPSQIDGASAEETGAPDVKAFKVISAESLKALSEADSLYRCGFCNFTAKKRHNVVVHERIHTGGTHIYKCQTCPFKAIRLKQYMIHQETKHQPETGFIQCHSCEFQATNRIELKRHHLTNHAKRVVLKCDKCDYKTLKITGMAVHQQKKHAQITKPQSLSDTKALSRARGYARKLSLKSTTRLTSKPKSLPFKCVICKFATSNHQALKMHMPIHAKKTSGVFTCDFCEFSSHKLGMLIRHNRHKCQFREATA